MPMEESGKLGATGRDRGGERREVGTDPLAGPRPSGPEPEDELLEVELTPSEVLTALARLDLEAALAYETAAGLVEDDELVRQLRRFGRDHRRHAEQLARLLSEEGDARLDALQPEEPLLAGVARVAAGLGPQSLALALLANEHLTNVTYEDVLAYRWDEELERLLVGFRADEERHVRWLSERHVVGEPAPAGQES